jgi:hypothetical protein
MELMETLFCVDYKAAQLRPRQAHRGTCDWIFGHAVYEQWFLSPRSGMLLLSGAAGAGKSVMTRYLAESIMAGGDEGGSAQGYVVVSFFCSYYEQVSNSEEVIVRSILHQLIQLNPRCEAIIKNRLQLRTPEGLLSFNLRKDLLWESVAEVLSMDTMKFTFIAIDAIEELGSATAVAVLKQIRRIIANLNDARPSHRVRVFLSSRHDPAYNSKIPSLSILRVPREQTTKSIESFLLDEVEIFAATNGSFNASTDYRSRGGIARAIMKRADGMFLWAAIAWDDFRRGLLWSPEIVRDKLARLDATPFGINALYDKMMEQVNPEVREDMWSIFSILAVAARPLNETELGIILGISKSQQSVTSSNDIYAISNLGEIINTNFPDLVIFHDDNGITFAHLSFKEYLLGNWETTKPGALKKARRIVTRTCLKYIQLKDLIRDAYGESLREGNVCFGSSTISESCSG